MLDTARENRFFSIAELNRLRIEAMHLFEQCLTNGNEQPFIEFVQLQLLADPPRLHLLHDLADDLQQRLLSLREYHFDVRDQVVRTFHEGYQVDITPLTPPAQLAAYHGLNTDAVLAFVTEQDVDLTSDEQLMLRKMVDASIKMARQLYHDIQLTEHLHSLVADWLEGFSATVARNNWQSYTRGFGDDLHPVRH